MKIEHGYFADGLVITHDYSEKGIDFFLKKMQHLKEYLVWEETDEYIKIAGYIDADCPKPDANVNLVIGAIIKIYSDMGYTLYSKSLKVIDSLVRNCQRYQPLLIFVKGE